MRKPKAYIVVKTVICPNCGDQIFSRAHHDFRSCTCGETAIDGGFDYVKLSFKKEPPKVKRMRIYATRKEIYDDYLHGTNQFGLIQPPKKTTDGDSQTEGWINVIRKFRK